MAYRGEHLYQCASVPFNWNQTHLVVVSGSGPNFCGHAIANAGEYYFHIDGLNDYPWYMSESGYKRYLTENEKKELRRIRVPLSKPDAAQRKLDELTASRWRWGVLPNNCATFVEEIFVAGGSTFSSATNCPTGGWK